jgi:hypothetical protein
MNTLKGIVGNLAVLRYLVIKRRIYKRGEIERLLDSIDQLLEKPENFSTAEIEAFQGSVTECIYGFEGLKEREEQSQAQKQEMEAMIKRLHQISHRCRKLQELEQFILRIMLTVKLYR